ncbi:MAG: hypothetical protein RO009_20150 [Pseudorhodoplanes sp.]|jgi:hypothetical protein|nr:hypothetical protein [Pseudorhodoplanes sp.]
MAPASPATNPPTVQAGPSFSYVQWGPIIAGAVAAAGFAFVLHSFAATIGLAVASTAPTWRDASSALWLTSGLYLLLVALASFGLGGYIAGRMRARLSNATPDEVEFRDGTHGLLVWALAVLLTGLLALGAAQSATQLAAPSGGTAGPNASVGGENLIAFDLDKLFRTERRPANVDMSYTRAEAARILLTASGHTGITAEDRSYLARLTASTTGIAPPDAEKRVDAAIASVRDNIARARRNAVILAFMAGAAALLGAAAAWFAACAGGRHRDEELSPSLLLRRRWAA